MAELTHEELAAAKGYMRVDGDEEDVLIAQCVLTAREYLAQAGVTLPETGTARRAAYDMACHALALSYYDLREPVSTGTLAENPGFRRLINQLKLTEEG